MTHDHGHGDDRDLSSMFTPEFWDERYRSADKIWSGNVNQRLVEQASDLAPGTALDVGSGEGGDAIWLASRGWTVTGVDVSAVALARAAGHAAAVGDQVAELITWQQADVLTWDPAPLQFDLVTAHFMQLPQPARDSLHRRLAAAVRPGGTLLVVGHDFSDLQTTAGRPHLPELFFTADEVVGLLDPHDWQIVFAGSPERQMLDPDGQLTTIHDAVVRAVRHRG